jgi:hypothetical protein
MDMPIISITLPIRNLANITPAKGVTKKCINKTMTMTGATETATSRSLFNHAANYETLPFD